MNIAVCAKWVRDPDSLAFSDRVTGAGAATAANEVVSQVDMVATELALRLAEQVHGEVSAYTFGGSRADGAMRPALAIGARRAVRIEPGDLSDGDSLATGRALAAALRDDGVVVVICGGRSPDLGSGFVPAVIARELGANLVRDVVAIEAVDGDRFVLRQKLRLGAQQIVEGSTPLVISVQPGAVEPRYPSTRAQILAEKMPIDVRPASSDVHGSGLVVSAILPPRSAAAIGPDPALPPKERYRIALSAGVEQRSASHRLEGEVDEIAGRLLELLEPFQLSQEAPV